MKSNSRRLIWTALVSGIFLTACGDGGFLKKAPDEPEDLEVSYLEDQAALYITWEEVEDADEYDIRIPEMDLKETVEDTEITIPCSLEGTNVTVKVRAVEDEETSDWSEAEAEIPILLDAPSDITCFVDGMCMDWDWADARYADYYQVMYGDQITDLSDSGYSVQGTSEGEMVTMSIRSVRDINGQAYTSDWVEVSGQFPTVDMESVNHYNAVFYDLQRLENWYSANGFEYDVTTQDDLTVVDVYFKDPNNSGFLNTAGRTVGAALGGYLVGAVEGSSNMVGDDFSGYANSIMTIFEYKADVKAYANAVKEEASESGAIAALTMGAEALFMDTDIHYKYYYQDTRRGAICMERDYILNGNEGYEESAFSSLSIDENGVYTYNDMTFQTTMYIKSFRDYTGVETACIILGSRVYPVE